MKKRFFYIFLTSCLLPLTSWSQVTATIDPIEILIGEQADVTLTVQADEGTQVAFPQLKPRQQLVEGVEVIGTRQTTPHTLTITVTSFDGKLYYLPPFKVKVGGKEMESKSLALKVSEVEVDTTQVNKFFGPKDVQDNPFQWSDWAPPFWGSVLMLLLAAASCWLWLRLRQGKPIITRIKMVKRLLPHQKAMREIEQIKADRMVTSADQKEYYTKLTDTLRRYIEERYGFSAMEMTSSEIIQRLLDTGDRQSMDELRQLFTTADLVKFAKYSTQMNENDMNLAGAIEFINQTKLENQPTEETLRPQLSVEDRRSRKQRRALKVAVGLTAAASAVLLACVARSLWLLLN